VVEKSDIIVQIVDGRDPTFYHCIDVDFYVKEVDPRKETFLLINKSDLLSDEIRSLWNKHFLSKNVNHMFFSAKIESEQVGVQ
jgi:large subunit GTPase 1